MIGQPALQVADGPPAEPRPFGELLLRQAQSQMISAEQGGERSCHDASCPSYVACGPRVAAVWTPCVVSAGQPGEAGRVICSFKGGCTQELHQEAACQSCTSETSVPLRWRPANSEQEKTWYAIRSYAPHVLADHAELRPHALHRHRGRTIGGIRRAVDPSPATRTRRQADGFAEGGASAGLTVWLLHPSVDHGFDVSQQSLAWCDPRGGYVLYAG